jgi:MFS family permease
MSTLSFILSNARWLAAGFVLALGSCFGQTFFIGVFGASIREEFSLTDGDFGAAYMLGTLASAAVIIQLGRLADIMSARPLAVIVTLGLACVCIAMSMVSSWTMLVFVIFGLRLFGQGLMSHLSATCMARWFDRTRGRAIAIASFGYPTAQAIAPATAVLFLSTGDWRTVWIGGAAILAVCVAPLLFVLLARDRPTNSTHSSFEPPAGIDGKQWRRIDVIKEPLFWLLVPGLVAPSFIGTSIFFLPSHISEAKGWALESFTNSYWLYGLTSLCFSIVGGFVVDKFSARASLPFYLLPMGAALITLSLGTSPWTIELVFILLGIATGFGMTVKTALWAEIYGTQHIGAIKALVHSVMVFASAAGPGLTGLLIDIGAPFPTQALYLAGYTVAVSGLYAWIVTRGPLGYAARKRQSGAPS